MPVLLVAVLMTLGTGIAGAASEPVPSGRIQDFLLDTTVQRHVRLRYMLYLPDGYGEDDTRWPMILYLHGAIGRGEDFDRVSWYPLPRLLHDPDRKIPFVVLMPQCPPEQNWLDDDQLVALLDTVVASHAVDPDRVYLAGYSMGGMGALHLASAHPDRFAAMATMSGLANLRWVPRLENVPVWVFHGAKDNRIPVKESDDLVAALTDLGAEVRFSRDPEGVHRPPRDEAHMALFEWFLRHRRKHPAGGADAGRWR